MFTSMLVIALAAGAATPAVVAKPNLVAPAVTSAASDSTAARQAKPTVYCVDATPTGTRIPRRECRPRNEWLDRGFDPLAKD